MKENIIMKKVYQIPEISVIEVYQEHFLMASDELTKRAVDGSPTTDDTFPTGIGTTSETTDPFGNKGQNGNSTRAKSGMIWDEW